MDYRLVATDMDGTLLNAEGQVPEEFWGILEELRSANVEFAPASGRQLATLRKQFDRAGEPLSFIAENGTVVVHHGKIISLTTLDEDVVHRVIDAARDSDVDMGLVICHPDLAYVERSDEAFRSEGSKYYVSLSEVSDLHTVVSGDVIKIAVFSFDDAESTAAPILRAAAPDQKVVVSGKHWVDIMAADANKGHALSMLRTAMGIDQSHTLAFGDYLNDMELLEKSGTSYAMANAHADILAVADKIAPANTDDGVVVVLRELLDNQ